jgi:hypothetical protein
VVLLSYSNCNIQALGSPQASIAHDVTEYISVNNLSTARVLHLQRLLVEKLAHSYGDTAYQRLLGEAHLARQAHQLCNFGGGLIRFDLDFHIKAVTETLGIPTQYRTLLVKPSGYFYPFITDGESSFCRNLRHMADQSEGHSRDEIG